LSTIVDAQVYFGILVSNPPPRRHLEAQVNKPLSTIRREKRAEARSLLLNASPEQTSYWREEYETHEQYTDRMLRHIEACPISALAVMGAH
jgi:hypothetical protein